MRLALVAAPGMSAAANTASATPTSKRDFIRLFGGTAARRGRLSLTNEFMSFPLHGYGFPRRKVMGSTEEGLRTC
jgi:hypothetical protein